MKSLLSIADGDTPFLFISADSSVVVAHASIRPLADNWSSESERPTLSFARWRSHYPRSLWTRDTLCTSHALDRFPEPTYNPVDEVNCQGKGIPAAMRQLIVGNQ